MDDLVFPETRRAWNRLRIAILDYRLACAELRVTQLRRRIAAIRERTD